MTLLWGGGVTTHLIAGPSASLILFIGLCALGVTVLPLLLGGVILAASAAWFAVVWLPGITIRPMWPSVPATSPVDWSMAIACGCALAAIVAIAIAATARGQA